MLQILNLRTHTTTCGISPLFVFVHILHFLVAIFRSINNLYTGLYLCPTIQLLRTHTAAHDSFISHTPSYKCCFLFAFFISRINKNVTNCRRRCASAPIKCRHACCCSKYILRKICVIIFLQRFDIICYCSICTKKITEKEHKQEESAVSWFWSFAYLCGGLFFLYLNCLW